MPMTSKLAADTALAGAQKTIEASIKAALTAKSGRTSDQVASEITAAVMDAMKTVVDAGFGAADAWAATHMHVQTTPIGPGTPPIT